MLFQSSVVLDRLFTLGFTIDQNLIISDATAALERLIPGIEGQDFLSIFKCQRPAALFSYKDIIDNQDSLFLLISRNHDLALKGQIIADNNSYAFRFVGMPWLAWMNENAPDVELVLSDFPKHDSQMDQQFYITGQLNMVRDLEKTNAKLIAAEENATQANRIQSELFAIMSHEMRTPLNGVISALTLLSDEVNPDEKERLFEVAQESANSLLNVINYALDFSKVDAGKMEIELVEFKLEDIVDSILPIVSSRATEKSISLDHSINYPDSKRLSGDGDKIAQVLINLVGNAIKYTDKGGVSLELNVIEETIDDVRLDIVVKDTGIGISSEDRCHIFEPFWGKMRGKREGSTGLGLSIVKRLVELMSGDINVESTEGQGTIFTASIPLKVASIQTEQVSVEVETPKSDRSLNGFVLLVDDNQTNLLLGKKILEKFDVKVRTASNGLEAVSIARELKFDLILMDIPMPEMDGIEATSLINKMSDPPPIVALTAYVGADKVEALFESGFKGYLQKPMDQSAFKRELNIWLADTKDDDLATTVRSDKAVLQQRTLELLIHQIGEENFVQVRKLFVAESEKIIRDLLGAWVRRDLNALRSKSHTLASSVASFGCDEFTRCLRTVEKAATDNDVPTIIMEMTEFDRISEASIKQVADFDCHLLTNEGIS